MYIFLTFLSALLLEGIGTIISIQGLSLLFGPEPLIIALAIAFDIGKLVGVSVLYREWKDLPKVLKRYLFLAAIVLMTITSAGAAGYLSAASQKALLPTKSIQVKVDAIQQEKQKLELRKKEIDAQIANLPPDMVKGRTKLINSFKDEIERTNNRIVEIDLELPKLQVELIEKSSHSGPITYIAEATSLTPEQAMGVIIGLVIFVFDPFAVALILAGNYLINKPKRKDEGQELIEKIYQSPSFTLEKAYEDFAHVRKPEQPLQRTFDISDQEPPEVTEVVQEQPIEEDIIEVLHDLYEEPEEDQEEHNPYFPAEMIEQAKEISTGVARSSLEDIKTTETVEFFDSTTSQAANKFYR